MPQSPAAGCPIRISALLKVFASPRGFSQLITSFFASKSQGILHVPFSPFRFLCRKVAFITTFASGPALTASVCAPRPCGAATVARPVLSRSVLLLFCCFDLLVCPIRLFLPGSRLCAGSRRCRIFQLPVCQCPRFAVVPGRVELPTSTLSV